MKVKALTTHFRQILPTKVKILTTCLRHILATKVKALTTGFKQSLTTKGLHRSDIQLALDKTYPHIIQLQISRFHYVICLVAYN